MLRLGFTGCSMIGSRPPKICLGIRVEFLHSYWTTPLVPTKKEESVFFI